MEQVTATILDSAGAVLLVEVTAFVQETPWGNWDGYFFAPDATRITLGERCHLNTNDGRSGDILVTGKADTQPNEQRVTFQANDLSET